MNWVGGKRSRLKKSMRKKAMQWKDHDNVSTYTFSHSPPRRQAMSNDIELFMMLNRQRVSRQHHATNDNQMASHSHFKHHRQSPRKQPHQQHQPHLPQLQPSEISLSARDFDGDDRHRTTVFMSLSEDDEYNEEPMSHLNASLPKPQMKKKHGGIRGEGSGKRNLGASKEVDVSEEDTVPPRKRSTLHSSRLLSPRKEETSTRKETSMVSKLETKFLQQQLHHHNHKQEGGRNEVTPSPSKQSRMRDDQPQVLQLSMESKGKPQPLKQRTKPRTHHPQRMLSFLGNPTVLFSSSLPSQQHKHTYTVSTTPSFSTSTMSGFGDGHPSPSSCSSSTLLARIHQITREVDATLNKCKRAHLTHTFC
eukprot:m.67646 g.67646  ORF g.67646 m.67646 type:complete len:363 (+) comp11585_c0_seq2:108-1196(+)